MLIIYVLYFNLYISNISILYLSLYILLYVFIIETVFVFILCKGLDSLLFVPVLLLVFSFYYSSLTVKLEFFNNFMGLFVGSLAYLLYTYRFFVDSLLSKNFLTSAQVSFVFLSILSNISLWTVSLLKFFIFLGVWESSSDSWIDYNCLSLFWSLMLEYYESVLFEKLFYWLFSLLFMCSFN